ncbi:hypothetical protein FTX61_04705 [Nitriliruptoraceae bacterium ZYF776]|nr:hypothetical protein [Profundirhabdus halotolerans]
MVVHSAPAWSARTVRTRRVVLAVALVAALLLALLPSASAAAAGIDEAGDATALDAAPLDVSSVATSAAEQQPTTSARSSASTGSSSSAGATSSFPAPGARSSLELRAEARFVAQYDAARRDPTAWYPATVEPPQPARTTWTDLRSNARYWSDRMAAEDRMYHNPDRRDQLCCWSRQGENVGWITMNAGQTPELTDRAVDRLVQMFMDSEGHRRNIMNPHTTEMGIGVRMTDRKLWVTVVFRQWDGRTTAGKGTRYDAAAGGSGSTTPPTVPPTSPPVRPPTVTPPGVSTPTGPPAGSGALVARGIDLACPTRQVPGRGFGDVASGSDLQLPVDCLAWWGVTSGVTAERYDPGGAVTRAQMASFIARALEASGARLPAASGSFVDLDRAGVHAESILRLRAAGVVGGFADGTFRPQQRVSREQMATFLAGAHRFRTGRALPSPARSWFRDVDGAHADAVNRLVEAGWALGTGPGSYAPSAPVTRGQMARFVTRWLDTQVGDHGARVPR